MIDFCFLENKNIFKCFLSQLSISLLPSKVSSSPMLQRPWPLLLEYDLTVPTPSCSYEWLCVGVLTRSQPTSIPGDDPCSVPPSPQDSQCFCLGFFQAFVNCFQSSFTSTKCCVPHLERRAQCMGRRCYCYTYTNKLVHQGSVVLSLSASSRPIQLFVAVFW